MKKILILSLCLLFFASCQKEPDDVPAAPGIEGEWVLSAYETKAVSIGTESVDIYLKFDGGAFSLYQKLGAGRYTLYTGTYTLTGTSLSGTYSDGKPWIGTYTVSMSGNNLVLSREGTPSEVNTFTPTTIPDSVKQNLY